MKNVVLVITLLLVSGMFLTVQAANNSSAKSNVKNVSVKNAYSTKDTEAKNNDYLLKYNIKDLEAAPWLNGGKRKI